MERKNLLKIITNQNYGKYEISGYSRKYNQLIPSNFVSLTSSTSVIPTNNKCGSYITIITPSSHVGHKVFAKIITENPKIRVCWYETNGSGYDVATGTYLDDTSSPLTTFSGIYELTTDMVYSDGYLQLYWWIYSGLETGQHTMKIQLVDLTEIYGIGNEPTSVSDFLTQYPIFDSNEPVFQTTANILNARTPFIFNKTISTLPNEYEELDSIESTGTQYIDTGFSNLTDKVFDIKFKIKSFGDDFTSIFGCQDAYNEFRLEYNVENVKLVCGDLVINVISEPQLNTEYELYFELHDGEVRWSVNGGEQQAEQETFTLPQNHSLYIFAIEDNNTAHNFSNIELIEFEIVANMLLIPAKRKNNNVVGMYDKVNNVFYENKGSGSFISGAIKSKTYILAPTTPMYLRGILTSKDTFVSYNGRTARKIGTRYQSGDENNPSVITTGTFTQYILDTPTYETNKNIRLPKGITSVLDANGVELEFVEK